LIRFAKKPPGHVQVSGLARWIREAGDNGWKAQGD